MPTSGTAAFVMDLADIVEDAYERCGVEVRTGYQFQTARRSLNLLLIEWQNRGFNLWTVTERAVPLAANTPTYTLPPDTIDILDAVVRRNSGTAQSDQVVERHTVTDYAHLNNKLTLGTPLRMYVNRAQAQVDVTLWPVPDAQAATLVYWCMRRIQDAGAGGSITQDVPHRFLPCLVAGLAYYLAMKLPDATARIGTLKSIYDEQWAMAASEDRDRSTLRIMPRIYG